MRTGVVEIDYRGRLGNWLVQYCIGRRLANELGFSLASMAIPGFPNAVPLGPSYDPDACRLARDRIHTAHEVDLDSVVADRRPRIIQLHGFFQRYEFLQPVKDVLRESWLASGPLPPTDPDELTIHIRAGDIWRATAPAGQKMVREYHGLPFSFYADVIGRRPWRKIHVVTEDPRDPMVQKLVSHFGVTVSSGEVMDDFNRLRASHNLVPSISTFAWWAAWLSNARQIYYPLAGLFDSERARRRPPPWRHDLWVSDESRYLPIELKQLDFDWDGSEEQRTYLLNS
jgi:hypothetical protein